jgi:hypothetical protein
MMRILSCNVGQAFSLQPGFCPASDAGWKAGGSLKGCPT